MATSAAFAGPGPGSPASPWLRPRPHHRAQAFATGPRVLVRRAKARAISAEMHSGFQALRQQMPMNVRATGRHVSSTATLDADIARIIAIWEECRLQHGTEGPWLFGHWSIADAMFAPVASRFRTYGVELPPLSQAYVTTVLSDPLFLAWEEAAQHEEVMECSEVGVVL